MPICDICKKEKAIYACLTTQYQKDHYCEKCYTEYAPKDFVIMVNLQTKEMIKKL